VLTHIDSLFDLMAAVPFNNPPERQGIRLIVRKAKTKCAPLRPPRPTLLQAIAGIEQKLRVAPSP
jgi:hypothetical protein